MATVHISKPLQPGDRALYLRPQFGAYLDFVTVKKVMATKDRYLIDRAGKRFWVRRATLYDREEAFAGYPKKAAIWWGWEKE